MMGKKKKVQDLTAFYLPHPRPTCLFVCVFCLCLACRYAAGKRRVFFECCVIGAMSYATAFGEALTICAFPYYSFKDR